MGYNTLDVNDYINELSKITKIDRQSVYVIVVKNFYKISIGEITGSEAYLNIATELSSLSSKKTVAVKSA